MGNTDIFLFSERLDEAAAGGVRMNKFISERANDFARKRLAERLRVNAAEIDILRSEKGKPYITGGKLHFNISHSGNVIAVAISENEVGVDVENVREYSEKVARRFFTKNELEYLDSCSDDGERRTRFFEIWTAKEAFLKYWGVGLSGGFDFDTATAAGMKRKIYSEKLGSAEILTFRKCHKCEACVMALCMNNFSREIVTINETKCM